MSFSRRSSNCFVAFALAGLWGASAAVPATSEPMRRIPLHVVEDSGSCRVDDGGLPAAAQAPALTVEQLQAIKLRMQAAVVTEQASGIIPLNGRGYNYRKADDPTRELLLIQRELESSR